MEIAVGGEQAELVGQSRVNAAVKPAVFQVECHPYYQQDIRDIFNIFDVELTEDEVMFPFLFLSTE